MVFYDDSILVFLHFLLIIPKSECFSSSDTHFSHLNIRVLLASIKNLGIHLCPRCLIRKDQVHELGTKRDMDRRMLLCRTDSAERRRLIKKVRKMIFKKGYSVSSKAIDDLLGDTSSVPIRVCIH